jgi:hypothetical protein
MKIRATIIISLFSLLTIPIIEHLGFLFGGLLSLIFLLIIAYLIP